MDIRKLNETEIKVLSIMENGDQYTSEDMYWIRYHCGCIYVDQEFPSALYLKDSPIFWRWYRQMWHLTDLKILSEANKTGQPISMGRYKRCQRTIIGTYYPPRTMLQAVQKKVAATVEPEQ